MTINFVPGDVNGNEQAVAHGRWKSHYVIVYGSGNNLIVSVRTEAASAVKNSLQTVYLPADPGAIDFNAENGLIAVSIGAAVRIYRTINEYMSQPRWTEATTIDSCGSTVNCLQWAPAEDELVVGTDTAIQLFRLYDEYGVLKAFRRWNSPQPLPTTNIKITHNANKIIAKSACYDRFLKLWTRINYGDDNTLFELSYLKHPIGDYVMDFRWRYRVYTTATFKVTDSSMAKIKNIRNYIDSHTEDSDTLYTFTKDKVVRVWSTYEYTGHNHIKCWGELDLSTCFDDQPVCAMVVIDNFYLKKCLFPFLEQLPDSDLVRYFKAQDPKNFDLLLAISESGQVVLYAVKGICMVPPNSVTFARINSVPMTLDENSFATIKTLHFKEEDLNEDLIQSDIYLRNLRPIVIPKTVFLNQKQTVLSFLVHDRMKNTLKLNSYNIRKMLAPNAATIGTTLLNKFQGHDKSVRLLKKSNPFLKNENVLLSAANFPDHNYIWEPLILLSGGIKHVSITKRFLLDLTQNTRAASHEGNRILDGVILNDIELLPGIRRHHLVITFDALGYLCLWDCNGSKYDDRPAKLIRSDLIKQHGSPITTKPKVFSLTELSESDELHEYCLIAIFSTTCVKSWKLSVYKRNLKIEFKKVNLTPPPIHADAKIQLISTLESHINEVEKNICSVIDEEGILRIFAINYLDAELKWVERVCMPTNVQRASRISGSTKINKVAIVDESGYKLSIWDLNSQVLEYEETFSVDNGKVQDLDWCMLMSSKNLSSNALLSVGFKRNVLLYTELRYDYTHDTPTYSVLKKIDITDYTSHEIGDSIWINNGYLVIGCGNQFFIDDRWIGLESSPSQFLNSTIRELVRGYTYKQNDASENGSKDGLVFDLSNIVRILNGPLPLYHPQFLIQLLIMTHHKLVEKILVALFQFIRQGKSIRWDLELDVLKEIQNEEKNVTKYQKLFQQQEDDDVFNTFNDSLSDLLTQHLTKTSLPLITRHQQITLTSVVRILKRLRKYTLTIDENGMRFLVGLQLFHSSSTQTKLTMRDINFALHSENKDVLIGVIEDTYSYQFTWSLIKKLGLVYWLDLDKLVNLLEGVARNEFSESRDPSGNISLFYLAMCKKQILLGLWRTVSHPEKAKMLKFLANDFTEKRWQTAAMKNAFALLGKHRYVDAAYFFLLADSVRDCCSILATKANDFQLALMVAKVYCKTSHQAEGPIIKELIQNHSIKRAVEAGDKWLSSWIFWEIGEKEKAVQALIRIPDQMFKDCDFKYPPDVKKKLSSETFLMSDPAAILLFKSLKTKTINYKIGSSQISKQEEVQTLLKTATIYTKMGCDFLALLLLRNWHFTYEDLSKKKTGKNGFDKFKQESHQAMATPPPTAFEEPDMSAFDFGF